MSIQNCHAGGITYLIYRNQLSRESLEKHEMAPVKDTKPLTLRPGDNVGLMNCSGWIVNQPQRSDK